MSSNLTDLNAAKFFENLRGFKPETLPADARELLTEMARQARRSILKMTTLAASGHPGGSMSSLEFYLLVYNFANLRPGDPRWADRDRVLISHGHTSPGIYSALGHSGFLDVEQAILGFRLAGSPFEGHVERSAPGVEWDSGNLGQGLSAACGKAVAGRALGKNFHVYALMGDGEQQKGQISEARRFAMKYGFTNITGVIDLNRLQISGATKTIMPQRIAENWRSDGWNVVEGDGHDLDEMYSLLRTARNDTEKPTVILAHTIMGKGYPPIENDHNYHGAALSEERCIEALAILGNDNGAEELESLKAKRAQGVKSNLSHPPRLYPSVATGSPRTYEVDKKIDNRSAWGNALVDLAEENSPEKPNGAPMVVFDCDLAISVKTNGFADKFPELFFQAGISEHSTATTAGACRTGGGWTFMAELGG
ncbi:MAG: transketolase, partial [candidate division Zixibacteria bacterium]|nr:transketolase [candidate division Zixibacteria bacterium]